MGFIFFDKVAGWVSASTFQVFPSDLLLSLRISGYFRKNQKNLVVTASHYKVFKIFTPKKTLYSGLHFSAWENIRCLAFRVGV